MWVEVEGSFPFKIRVLSLEASSGFSSACDVDELGLSLCSGFPELGCGDTHVGFVLTVAHVFPMQRPMNGLLKSLCSLSPFSAP